jgi:hypothetical protein
LLVFDNRVGDLVRRETIIHFESLLCKGLISSSHVFKHIPFNIKRAERAESIFLSLDPERQYLTPIWATDPKGVHYVGELHFGKRKNFNQEEVNNLITDAISSPAFQDLRVREIQQIYRNIKI